MLDIIRKKASDWFVKVIFGIIIIVFIFFFGYNRMSQRYSRGGNVVAKVNGMTIGRAEYSLAYDNTYKMYQNIFKGKEDEPLPEGIVKSVRTTALNQLIQQAVVKSLGERLDLDPSSLELAEAVRNSPAARGEDGRFDPYMYKHNFLPYFAQKFHMDYEDLVESELLIQKVRDIFASEAKAPFARYDYDIEHTKWSFEVTEYESEEAAKSKKGGKIKKLGPIGISGRGQIFGADVDIPTWEKIFSLSTGGGEIQPVGAGGKWYTVKVTKLELPVASQWEKDRETYLKAAASRNEDEAFRTWISYLLKNSKIKTFIEE